MTPRLPPIPAGSFSKREALDLMRRGQEAFDAWYFDTLTRYGMWRVDPMDYTPAQAAAGARIDEQAARHERFKQRIKDRVRRDAQGRAINPHASFSVEVAKDVARLRHRLDLDGHPSSRYLLQQGDKLTDTVAREKWIAVVHGYLSHPLRASKAALKTQLASVFATQLRHDRRNL